MIFENGLEECPCKKKGCERHGKCFECLEYHKLRKRPAYCKRKNSIASFLRKKLSQNR
ncbi:hypothetical protein EHE19_002280 [Ruminiclostridium herbifermentans]|uniref:Uncharacterized protein n=1 Tax=Ruminiclostridium herbifermentans TaxID=2488810 RepID=A0A7H1VPS6_9FIRM|nr:hypothetical protein [Ruminiclostridium herbifermentans]QNU67388.1 hypothetical protein EHE19_002280 [Ruminiclostridium herbifermentans]